MDLIAYLTTYYLLNLIYHPLNVFLLFTSITTIISLIFIYIGKITGKIFNKKNNLILLINTFICFMLFLILLGLYETSQGYQFSLNIRLWVTGSIFAYLMIKEINWVNKKYLKEYNLPKLLKNLILSLLASAITWFLIITSNYIIWGV